VNTNASMGEQGAPSAPMMAVVFRIVVVFDTVALLVAAALHVAGARFALGSVVFAEPQMVPAAIVEGLDGLVFAAATYAVLTGKRWAWTMTLIAHVFAILGFLLGLFSTRNGTTPFNHDYHLIMLAIFVIGLTLLFTPAARAALGQGVRKVRTR